jgi:hypothetical protein
LEEGCWEAANGFGFGAPPAAPPNGLGVEPVWFGALAWANGLLFALAGTDCANGRGAFPACAKGLGLPDGWPKGDGLLLTAWPKGLGALPFVVCPNGLALLLLAAGANGLGLWAD